MHSGENMAIWQNKIPLSAVIFETIVVLILIYITTLLFIKYQQRKKKPNLYLGLAFLNFTLASMTTAIGRWAGFFSPVSYLELSITDLTTVTSYIFIALSSCFAVAFVDSIFIHKGLDFALIFFLLNGVIIGLILVQIYYWIYVDRSFGLIRKPAVNLIVVAVSVLALIAYVLITVFSFRESRLTDERLHKIGFNLIGMYGIFIPMLFVAFAIDTVLISSVETFANGYSPMYYLGWVFAIVGLSLGYLGYIMPGWFRKLISKVETS